MSTLACRATAALLSGLVASLAACGGSDEAPRPCNPLGGVQSCLAPFPSAAFLVPDDSQVTGFRVDFDQSIMPMNVVDEDTKAAYWNRFDGFSGSLIIAAFPGGVSVAGLPTWRSPELSLTAESPTVLLDMTSGERILHFAEIDMGATNLDDQALIIRPLAHMPAGHRYAVAIRKSVKGAGGGALTENAAFTAILAGKNVDHPLFSRIKDRYPEIFAALEADGVPRTDLALAWDFVTASEQFLTSDLLTMRDKALPVMGDGSSIGYAASEVSTDNPDVLRVIVGTYQAPTFLTDGEADPSILKRGADGKPELNGEMTANFAAIVPQCAATSKGPLPVLVFGHGLFGTSLGYVDDDLLQRVANENCVIVIAGDWIGLTERNIGTVALALNRLDRAPTVTDKLAQAVINFMTLVRLAKGSLGQDPLFQVDGVSVIDPTRIWYFGASLGGIMGGTFMAYEPEITRGTLGVAGCQWTMCFERSAAWPPLRLALQSAYPGLVGNQEILALFGMVFDRVDGATTAYRVIADPLPGVPPKQIWFYWAIGDSLVANLASEAMARRFGLKLTGPSVSKPFGLEESLEPLSSGATIYDERPTPLPSDLNLATADDNGTHGGVHERNAILSAIKRFFETGELVHGCALDGVPAPCDCTTGACDNFVE